MDTLDLKPGKKFRDTYEKFKSKDRLHFLSKRQRNYNKKNWKKKILEKRSDDNLQTILKRYDTYMLTTRPVLDFYNQNSNFNEIDGSLKIDEITAKIEGFLTV